MLLKAIEQLQDTAKMVEDSPWEMPKGYWKATGKHQNKTDIYWTSVPIGWM
jgi:hypothetical protein